MKNAALFAPYFLPRRRVGAWRPFKFAIHLKEHGWQPHIITIKSSSGQLTPKEQELLSGIPIYEMAPPFDFTDASGSSIATGESSNSGSPASPITDRLLGWVDRNFPVDTWLPLFWLRKRAIIRHINSIDPAVIWSTGDPWSSHWLAGTVARAVGRPWVADFRDPWTLGKVNLKERSAFSSRIDRRAEQRVVQQAAALTFTSEATEQLYRASYPANAHKMRTIYNCFDRQLYDEPEEEPGTFSQDLLHLLFFGKFRRLSPAKPLVDILCRLREELETVDLPVRVHSFGPLSDEDEAYARAQGVLKNFEEETPVPAEKGLHVMRKADISWLSTHPDRNNIIPAKLWDYLAAGRPILSIAPNPEIARILKASGAGLQFDHTKEREKVVRCLRKCLLAKKEGKPFPISANRNGQDIGQFEASQVTRELADVFNILR